MPPSLLLPARNPAGQLATTEGPLPCGGVSDESGNELVEAAYRRYRGAVYRYLLRRTRDRHDAEDLTQAVFADALVRLPGLDREPDSMLAWLYTVAERRFADEVRRRARWRRRLPLLAQAELVDPAEYGPAAVRAIASAIGSLPASQREIVLLRLFDDVPFAEIARRLGATEPACKMRFKRAITHIRNALEREGLARDE